MAKTKKGKRAKRPDMIGNVQGFKKGNKAAQLHIAPALKMGAREFVLRCIGGDEGVKAIVAKAFQKAKAGSYRHQELLLNYILGKPVDKVKLDVNGNLPVTSAPVVKIIADHLRLEKLEKDLVAAPPIVSASAIEEMENILNKEINGE